MRSEDAAHWRPTGVGDLEPAADAVVRGAATTLVVAGPGAGKTELLAQRACFLLQTGKCADPERILAISFKRDAARNLRERVALRCGHSLAARFDSYTFDAFAKGLVDRFRSALPPCWRVAADYAITNISKDNILDLAPPKMARGPSKEALWRAFVDRPLPADGVWHNASAAESAAAATWNVLLENSTIGFPMLARLVELLLRVNPGILAALRGTYRHAFLDEFQDTTAVQYDLIHRTFSGSSSVLTAVGDHKQRIMVWADAREDVFERFEADFAACRVSLVRNYRSARELVYVQSFVARALDPLAVEAVAMDDGGGLGECRLLIFENERQEAERLAVLVRGWIHDDGLAPREICLLCRERAVPVTERIRAALDEVGVQSRVENAVQDLLAEPLTECVLDVLKLACRTRDPAAWRRTARLLGELRGESDGAMQRIIESLIPYLDSLSRTIRQPPASIDEIAQILENMMAYIGVEPFQAAYPQYAQGGWYKQTMAGIAKALHAACGDRTWSEGLDEFEGIGIVPIMTVHKSKGLEYHTIVFVGLEDRAFRSFKERQNEETCGFFVALSRANKRAIFTFSGRRSGWGQQREIVHPLYELLRRAGIVEEGFTENGELKSPAT